MKKSTLILLVVAVGLGAFVYFYEIKGGKRREEAKESAKQIFQFKQEDIAQLSLTRASETMGFEKRGDEWVMTQPLSVKADQSNLDAIARNLTTSQIERKLPAAADKLATYGLSEPRVTATVKLKNGEQHQLRLGNEDFAKTFAYALIDNSPEVALVPTYLLTSADKTRFELRDKSVVDVSQSEVNTLELKTSNGQFLLTKHGENWQLQQPRQLPADSSEVSSILSQLSFARMTDVVEENPQDLKTYGLDRPTIAARLRTEKGAEQVLTLGKKVDEQCYGKINTRSPVFKVSADLYKKLDATLFSLRNKKPVPVDQDQITRLRLKNEHQTIVAEKNGDKWILKEPADKKGKEVKQYEIFNPLETSDAKEIFDTPSKEMTTALANPAVEVQLTKIEGQTITVSISKKVGDSVYVRNSLSPAVMKFEGSLLDQLNVKVEDLL
ncbi:MAG: DUF4340 domain-containing protein [Acidobacteria bacterium]|nr:DUF4340 domain-containing protein [Acidobacteriota bacterium]